MTLIKVKIQMTTLKIQMKSMTMLMNLDQSWDRKKLDKFLAGLKIVRCFITVQ